MEKEGWMLVKRHAFGARSDPHNALCWVDEGTLMYPVGKTVALHQLSTNNQRFLDSSYCNVLGITSIAISENKKFVAIAEGGENPQVQVIDTMTRKRRKLLSISPSELGSDRFIAMAFSTDGRHLVTQGGGPSWNLYYWNWERSKPLAMISLSSMADFTKLTQKHKGRGGPGLTGDSKSGAATSKSSPPSRPLVTHVSICPSDAVTIAVSGMNFICLYRYTDGFLQPQPGCGVPSESEKIFVTHCWVDKERLVASTHQGELLLIERGHYVEEIHVPNVSVAPGAASAYGRSSAHLPAITAICPTQAGFVTGNNQGMLCTYHRNRQEDAEGEGLITFGYSSSPSYSFYSMVCIPSRDPCELAIAANTDKGVDLGFPKDGTMRQTLSKTHYENGDGTGNRIGGKISHSNSCNNSNHISVDEKSLHEVDTPLPVPHFSLVTENSTGALPPIAKANSRSKAQHSSPYLSSGGGSNMSMADTVYHSGTKEAGGVETDAAGLVNTNSTLVVTTRPFMPTFPVLSRPGTGGVVTASAVDCCEIAALALNQSGTRLAVLTRVGRVYGTDFRVDWSKLPPQEALNYSQSATVTLGTNPGAYSESGGINKTSASTPSPLFEAVCQPFHTGAINGMDCCARKPFLITSSSDHSVRLWNINTNKLEMIQYYSQEPGAVAIHPSGLMAVVCFPDKVCVMSVLWNTLLERKVINFRYATNVVFSHGGQYFAVAHNNLVDVFISTTCEPCGQLRGHLQRIKDMKWSATSSYPTDNRLITCSMDGMMIDWNTFEMRKEVEHSDKRFQYSAVDADDKSVWAVASPMSSAALGAQWKVTLREIERSSMASLPSASPSGTGTHTSAATEDYEFIDTALTALRVAPHRRMLFGGGEDGSLKVMSFPLQASIQESPLTAHSARITRMALTLDESTLFTASEDGSVFVWDIREEGTVAGRAVTFESTSTMGGIADEVLVTQQYMEDTKLEIESLQQQIEKLKTELSSEERRHTHEQGTRIRERTEEYKNEASTLAMELASLLNSKREQERTFVSIKAEKTAEAAQKLESVVYSCQEKVQELEKMCSNLQHTLEAEQEAHANGIKELEESVAREQREEQERYEEILSQKREALEALRVDVEHSCQINEEALRQLELDIDTETQTVSERHNQELNTLRERFLHMKGEGAIMRKNAVFIAKEVEVRTGEVALLDAAKVNFTAQLEDLRHSVNQLHQDIDERDVVIGEKEKHIYALKRENQELEKYRFVLDYRIRQLKALMEPKQREMLQCNQRIKLRNRELEELHECNRTLQGNIDELRSDIAEQQRHIKHMHNTIKDFETYKTRFQRDVGDVVPALQDVCLLQQTIENIYQTHVVARGGKRIASVDPNIRSEFQNHLEYLSTSVNALQRKLKLEEDRHKKEVSAMMVENMSLIREIHSLRGEIHHLRTLVTAETAAKRARGSFKAGGRSTKRRDNLKSSKFPSIETKTRKDSPLGRGDVSQTPSVNPLRTVSPSQQSSSSVAERMAGATSISMGEVSGVSGAADALGESSSERGPLHLRTPAPPLELERTCMELRMLRSYIEVMEQALGSEVASSVVKGVLTSTQE
ncbi:unnamed protein product [Phytomonas sp. EM1]|nr:unnamed protein product [Phytomonas sp. EM1]|eukprot:CCW63626.1 unnamed protein product [Phytomonas sp. isolate EM1]